MKRIFLFLLCLVTFAFSAFSFCACSQNEVPPNGADNGNVTDETENVKMKNKFRVYSLEEIKKDPQKKYVEIYYYPASGSYMSGDNGKRKDPFAIVCPGGGYTMLAIGTEGTDIAEALNGKGVTAFVLQYSYASGAGNEGVDFRPQRDMFAAISYIAENSEYFGVDPLDYALFGSSAGANLVSTYPTNAMASYCGYDLNSLPKPSCLVLSYPWLNLEKSDPSLISGIRYVAGDGLEEDKVSLLCPYRHLDESYPPVYMWWSTDDKLVPPQDNEELMREALNRNGVKYSVKVVGGLEHGGGLNKGNAAEGWFDEAIAFWSSLR